MPSVTGNEIVNDAFALLGAYGPAEVVPATDAQIARRMMNDLLSEWSQRAGFIPVIRRERFDLVADQGAEDDPYTIGDGGDFDTIRPANQTSIVAANLILTSSDPEVRVPLVLLTDMAYDWNQVPSQTATQPTSLYYNPTYEDDLGSIYLWPVPNIATNDLELFIQEPVAQFANLTAAHSLPPGLPRALKYNLAVSLQGVYPFSLAPSAQQIAVTSLATFNRTNLKLVDIPNDAAIGQLGAGLYNILSDTSGHGP